MNTLKLWIARDKNGWLVLYTQEPDRHHEVFSKVYEFKSIPPGYFPEVTFENSPQQVELKLIEK